MGYDIRQLSFGEILDQAFQVLRDRFVLLWGMGALLHVPSAFLQSLFPPIVGKDLFKAELSTLVISGLSGLVVAALVPLVQLAVTKGVADTYLSKEVQLGSAFRTAGSLYLRYMGTMILMGLALMGLALLLLVPALYFGVAWTLVGPILVVEELAGMGAMKRSRELVSGHWWRTLGLVFVATALSGLVAAALGAVLGAIPFAGPLLVGAAQALGGAFGSIVIVVAYFDLRCRKEDFDLQVLMRQVQAPGSGVPARTVG